MNPQIEALSEIIGSCNTRCDHPFDCSHCKAIRVYDAGYRKVEDIANKILELALLDARKMGGLKPFITIEDLDEIAKKIKEEIK